MKLTNVRETLADLNSDLKQEALDMINNLSAKDEKEIRSLLDQHSDATGLMELLGREAGAGAMGHNLLESGNKLFLNMVAKVQPVICGSRVLKAYAQNATAMDAFTVSALIAGGLTGKLTAGVNVPLVSVIVVRMGLRNFCSNVWND